MKKIILLTLCCFICSIKGFSVSHIEPALFSVSKDTKVIFSTGNVQYHPKKNIWRFAPDQYDVIGKTNAKIAPSYNGWIDLFGWGTGNNPCHTTENYKDYSEFADWGIHFTTDEIQWRTLTQKEWQYLLLERENASKLVGMGSIAGTLGVFILPDNGIISQDIEFVSFAEQDVAIAGSNYLSDGVIYINKYTEKEWKILEANGVVFLPLTGKRDVKTIEEIGNHGYYWSSNNDPRTLVRSYGLLISNMNIKIRQSVTKQVGCAVRLVYNIK